MRAARAAVVGIDGAGKTTIIRSVRQRNIAAGDLVILPALAVHEVPAAPLQSLSRHLAAASSLADKVDSAPLKAAVLYLQMTLFAPVERFLRITQRPRLLLSDRDPLIDTLVYGELYQRLLGPSCVPADGWEVAARRELERNCPGAYRALISWLRSLGARAAGAENLEGLVESLSTMFAQPTAHRLRELQHRYATGLPELVLLLDVEPAVAAERVNARHRARSELHEQAAYLEHLRASYHNVVELVRRTHPEVSAESIANHDSDEAVAVDEVLAHLSLRRQRSREPGDSEHAHVPIHSFSIRQ
jgi:thymidylate kinase